MFTMVNVSASEGFRVVSLDIDLMMHGTRHMCLLVSPRLCAKININIVH